MGKQKIKILINRDNFLCGKCMQECKQGQTLVLKSAVKTKGAASTFKRSSPELGLGFIGLSHRLDGEEGRG